MEYVEFDRANISNTTEMYAIVDSRNGDLIFRLDMMQISKDDLMDFLNQE